MDPLSRRELLIADSNPENRLDYVISLADDLVHGEDHDHPSKVRLRYIPDNLILRPESFGTYLDRLSDTSWPSLEAAAAAIIDDINNELVPRWVQVSVELQPGPGTTIHFHSVILEDKQPKWENPDMLSRLGRIG